MTMELSVKDLDCAPDAHYQTADGWTRCHGVQHRLPLRWADSKVCPFCLRHFTPARGAAISHARACALEHGQTWPA
jgi:hypothetical protein